MKKNIILMIILIAFVVAIVTFGYFYFVKKQFLLEPPVGGCSVEVSSGFACVGWSYCYCEYDRPGCPHGFSWACPQDCNCLGPYKIESIDSACQAAASISLKIPCLPMDKCKRGDPQFTRYEDTGCCKAISYCVKNENIAVGQGENTNPL